MSAPAITTLLTPNPASGNTTTDGTEQTLASGTAAGVYQLLLNAANMVDGDIIELRAYGKANGSDAESQMYMATFAHTQTDKLKASLAIVAPSDVKFTIKRVAGTDRSYQWGVVNLSGA